MTYPGDQLAGETHDDMKADCRCHHSTSLKRIMKPLAAYPLLVMVVASCGMAPMARNMMLKKETPKMARDPVAVLSIPLNKDPMIRDMMTTCINLCRSKHICQYQPHNAEDMPRGAVTLLLYNAKNVPTGAATLLLHNAKDVPRGAATLL